jgi:hypothetical protein
MRRFTTLCTAVTLGLLAGPVAVVVAGARQALACSCAARTEKQAFADADTVFIGKLLGTEVASEPGPVYSTGDEERFFFAVNTVFKGTATDRQTIVTSRDGASCGLEIGGPGPFVVFTYRDGGGIGSGAVDGELYSHLCSGTRPLSVGDVPASFGGGHPPAVQNGDDVDDVDEVDEVDEDAIPSVFAAALSIWAVVFFPFGAHLLGSGS